MIAKYVNHTFKNNKDRAAAAIVCDVPVLGWFVRLDGATGVEYRFVPSELMQEVTGITVAKDFEIHEKNSIRKELKISKVAEIA